MGTEFDGDLRAKRRCILSSAKFGRHGAGDRLRASGTQDANCARRLRGTYLPDEI